MIDTTPTTPWFLAWGFSILATFALGYECHGCSTTATFAPEKVPVSVASVSATSASAAPIASIRWTEKAIYDEFNRHQINHTVLDERIFAVEKRVTIQECEMRLVPKMGPSPCAKKEQ